MLPKVKTILYATGIGAGAPYVFRYALSLAHQYKARIVAVHAMEPMSNFAQSLVELHISHERSEEIHAGARDHAKARLNDRINRLIAKEIESIPEGRDLVSEIRILEGQPAVVLLEQAKAVGADLIVMGSHRHTVLGDAMLGTTTHKVLHSTPLPVVVVRIPEGYHEEGF